MANITVWSDSFGIGIWDTKGGWVSRLRCHLNTQCIKGKRKETMDHRVHNFSRSGDQTEILLNRLPYEAKTISWGEPSVFIFSIGMNDTQYDKKVQNSRTSSLMFKKNYEKIITTGKKFGKKVFATNLTPVDESKTDPVPWKSTIAYKNETIDNYNSIIEEISKKKEIKIIDIHTPIKKAGVAEVLFDGVHPNDAGHRIIFETVRWVLEKEQLV